MPLLYNARLPIQRLHSTPCQPPRRSTACLRRLLRYAAGLLFTSSHPITQSRPSRHTEALRIFVHGLRSPAQAEAYCDRVYQRRQLALREQRRAELAAALRRQRRQDEAAAAAAVGGPAPASGRVAGPARGLQFEGPGAGSLAALTAGSGAAPSKLQPALARSSSVDGADIYLLLVQASAASSGAWLSRAAPSCLGAAEADLPGGASLGSADVAHCCSQPPGSALCREGHASHPNPILSRSLAAKCTYYCPHTFCLDLARHRHCWRKRTAPAASAPCGAPPTTRCGARWRAC